MKRLCAIVFILFVALSSPIRVSAVSMPYLSVAPPNELVERARFITDYSKSTAERKHNILLASKFIDKTLLCVGEEFSFNHVVGRRTENRGFKSAKIIVNGEFVDGVGGGVCQVSTTLYNAVILAGLCVLEYHPHSLQVGYVPPSRDAMVNSSGADLRFVNNTDSPLFLRAQADGNNLVISVWGRAMRESFSVESAITGKNAIPQPIITVDDKGEYPDLLDGQKKVLRYAKQGIRSESYLVKRVDGKVVERIRLRKDSYASIGEIVVIGKAQPPLGDVEFGESDIA